METQDVERRLAAILAADVVGYRVFSLCTNDIDKQ